MYMTTGEFDNLLKKIYTNTYPEAVLEFIQLTIDDFCPTQSHIAQLCYALIPNSRITTLRFQKNLRPEAIHSLGFLLSDDEILTSIEFSNIGFGDGEAEIIAKALRFNKTLQNINLERNRIDVGGAEALSESLKVNESITSLNLRSNCLCDDSAIFLAEALKVNKTLKHLDLRDNNISAVGKVALAEAMEVNQTLTTLFAIDTFAIDSDSSSVDALKRIQEKLLLNGQNEKKREVLFQFAEQPRGSETEIAELKTDRPTFN